MVFSISDFIKVIGIVSRDRNSILSVSVMWLHYLAPLLIFYAKTKLVTVQMYTHPICHVFNYAGTWC